MQSNFSLTRFVLSMADYYLILVRAVSGLDPNTPSARRRLYERARSALLSEMQNAYPPIARPDIVVAQMGLDMAIGQVEADACLMALEKSGKHTQWGPTAVEHDEEHGRPCQPVQPPSVASGSPSRVMPCRVPPNQNIERRGHLSAIRRLFRWPSTRTTKCTGERDTWLTDLLERASREENEGYQDFTPKRA